MNIRMIYRKVAMILKRNSKINLKVNKNIKKKKKEYFVKVILRKK